MDKLKRIERQIKLLSNIQKNNNKVISDIYKDNKSDINKKYPNLMQDLIDCTNKKDFKGIKKIMREISENENNKSKK